LSSVTITDFQVVFDCCRVVGVNKDVLSETINIPLLFSSGASNTFPGRFIGQGSVVQENFLVNFFDVAYVVERDTTINTIQAVVMYPAVSPAGALVGSGTVIFSTFISRKATGYPNPFTLLGSSVGVTWAAAANAIHNQLSFTTQQLFKGDLIAIHASFSGTYTFSATATLSYKQ